MLPIHCYQPDFHQILQVLLHIKANPKKSKAEVEMQKNQDGGRRHFEFFR
jgi:hypothetical protein